MTLVGGNGNLKYNENINGSTVLCYEIYKTKHVLPGYNVIYMRPQFLAATDMREHPFRLLGYYAAYDGLKPTFRDYLSVLS